MDSAKMFIILLIFMFVAAIIFTIIFNAYRLLNLVYILRYKISPHKFKLIDKIITSFKENPQAWHVKDDSLIFGQKDGYLNLNRPEYIEVEMNTWNIINNLRTDTGRIKLTGAQNYILSKHAIKLMNRILLNDISDRLNQK